MPFRGARRGGKTGAGVTVHWNDIGLSTQRTHSARDGRTVAWPDSRAASGDRRGEDSPYDPSARCVSRHLMPLSGEQAGHRESRVGLERCRDLLKGRWSLERGGNPLRGASVPRARRM
jgi:hypothetical protein